jgi:hypothetical protein
LKGISSDVWETKDTDDAGFHGYFCEFHPCRNFDLARTPDKEPVTCFLTRKSANKTNITNFCFFIRDICAICRIRVPRTAPFGLSATQVDLRDRRSAFSG